MSDFPIATSKHLYHQVASLLLYQSVFKNEVGEAFLKLLHALFQPGGKNSHIFHCLTAYSHWFQALARRNISWKDFLIEQILFDDNPFSRQVQKLSLDQLPVSLVDAVKHDLYILQNAANCDPQNISKWVQDLGQIEFTPLAWDIKPSGTTFLHSSENWTEILDTLWDYYRAYGIGIFAQYQACHWQDGQLWGIIHPDPIQLDEIFGYELQKDNLIKNTEFLLAGFPALHILLYGSRGSGKSSLVKGLLQRYGQKGLRLIEVGKSDLRDLGVIVEKLRDLPQKFVIFVDDLSFEEDDDTFKALKVVLEGSLTARARNVVVYATSNRRHLVREFFSDRPRPSDMDEVHSRDTVQEKLSFSDRFGLTLTFEQANQETYLNIVRGLAKQEKIPLDWEEMEYLAKQWAIRHNGFSGRTARQFIDFLQGELGLT